MDINKAADNDNYKVVCIPNAERSPEYVGGEFEVCFGEEEQMTGFKRLVSPSYTLHTYTKDDEGEWILTDTCLGAERTGLI